MHQAFNVRFIIYKYFLSLLKSIYTVLVYILFTFNIFFPNFNKVFFFLFRLLFVLIFDLCHGACIETPLQFREIETKTMAIAHALSSECCEDAASQTQYIQLLRQKCFLLMRTTNEAQQNQPSQTHNDFQKRKEHIKL